MSYLGPVWPLKINILRANHLAVLDMSKWSWKRFLVIQVDGSLEIQLLWFTGGRVIDHGLQLCNTAGHIPLDGDGACRQRVKRT